MLVSNEISHLPEAAESSRDKLNKYKRLLGSVATHTAIGLLAAAPFTTVYSLHNAEVSDAIGPLPTKASLAPGHSTLGLGGNRLISFSNTELTSHGLGLSVEASLPTNMETLSTGSFDQLVKPVVGMYQDPKAAADGYKDAVEEEVKADLIDKELELGLLLGGLSFGVARASRELSPERRKALTYGVPIGLLAVSSYFASQEYSEWTHDTAIPVSSTELSELDGTPFEGTTASNSLLASAATNIIPRIKTEVSAEQARSEEFLQAAYTSIDEALDAETFKAPDETQTLALVLSDIHSNHDMIQVYQQLVQRINQKHGDNTLRLTLLAGDQTYGSATEKNAVHDIAHISKTVVGVDGNHDGKLIDRVERENHIKMLDGNTVDVTQYLSVLGNPDPSLTPVNALFGLQADVSRGKDDKTHLEAGQELVKEAAKTDPTVIISHEAYTLEPMINKDDISEQSMKKWFAEKDDSSSSLDSEDGGLPASAIFYGHWHDKFLYKVIRDENGKGEAVVQLGTAGGAATRSMDLAFTDVSDLSLPWTVPVVPATGALVTFNNETSSIAGLQEITTQTNGTFEFQEFHSIDQPADLATANRPDSNQVGNPTIIQ